MKKEEFVKEHPSLKEDSIITEGTKEHTGHTRRDIHETQLDKDIVSKAIFKIATEFPKEDNNKVAIFLLKELGLDK